MRILSVLFISLFGKMNSIQLNLTTSKAWISQDILYAPGRARHTSQFPKFRIKQKLTWPHPSLCISRHIIKPLDTSARICPGVTNTFKTVIIHLSQWGNHSHSLQWGSGKLLTTFNGQRSTSWISQGTCAVTSLTRAMIAPTQLTTFSVSQTLFP